MKNADLPAMPNSNPETYPVPCSINYGAGLTKLEVFAMHAPEAPDWFGRNIINQMLDSGKNPIASDELRESIYFEWRKYYAEKMCEVYEC